MYITPLVVILPFWDILFCFGFLFIFFFSLCSLCFAVLEVSVETSLNSEILSSAVKSTNKLIKGILYLLQCFDLQHFFLLLSWTYYLSVCIAYLFFHAVYLMY